MLKPIENLAAEHAMYLPDDDLPPPPAKHPMIDLPITHYRDYRTEQINTPIHSCPTARVGGVLVPVGPPRIVGVVEGTIDTSVTFVTADGGCAASAMLVNGKWVFTQFDVSWAPSTLADTPGKSDP